MSHELAFRNGRADMAYAGDAPWHKLGQRAGANATLDEWIMAAGMEWTIQRSKPRFILDPVQAENPRAWGVYDDKRILWHSDTRKPLSVVSKDYKIVQPRQVMEFFRSLTEAGQCTMDTAGVLFDGRQFWAMASIGAEATVVDKSDPIKGYLLFSTSCDGTLANEIRDTLVRVVCNNTLTAARLGKARVRKTHRSVFDMDDAKRALGLVHEKADEARESFADTIEQFRRMARTGIDSAAIFDATGKLLIPAFDDMTPDKQADAVKGNRTAMKIGELAVNAGRQIGGTLEGVKGTAWGWLNAVTEHVDHHHSTRGDYKDDNRLRYAMLGDGASLKTKAYEIAVAMADGSIESCTEYRAESSDTLGNGLLDAVLAETTAC